MEELLSWKADSDIDEKNNSKQEPHDKDFDAPKDCLK